MTRGSTGWKALLAGTATRLLKTNGPGALPSYSNVGDSGSRITYNGNTFQNQTTNPSNPTGTTSTSPLMMGCAVAFTPNTSGNVEVKITGVFQNTVANDGAGVRFRYGTGTAPINGAALTGTAAGSVISVFFPAGSNAEPFTITAFITLIAGTVYWLDVAVNAVTGGTGSAASLAFSISENP